MCFILVFDANVINEQIVCGSSDKWWTFSSSKQIWFIWCRKWKFFSGRICLWFSFFSLSCMTCFCVHMEMFQRSFPLRESFYCTEEESRLILSVFVCVCQLYFGCETSQYWCQDCWCKQTRIRICLWVFWCMLHVNTQLLEWTDMSCLCMNVARARLNIADSLQSLSVTFYVPDLPLKINQTWVRRPCDAPGQNNPPVRLDLCSFSGAFSCLCALSRTCGETSHRPDGARSGRNSFPVCPCHAWSLSLSASELFTGRPSCEISHI